MKNLLFFVFCFLFIRAAQAEDGYRLWLRYDRITNGSLLEQYRKRISTIYFSDHCPVLKAAKEELINGLENLLGKKILTRQSMANGCVVAGRADDPAIHSLVPATAWEGLGKEGFIIRTIRNKKEDIILIAGNEDVSVLYGVFHLLRLLQTHEDISKLSLSSVPKIGHRILNHWDNLNR